MLSEEERQAYQDEIDGLLAQSIRNIEMARKRGLDARGKDMIARAEGFLSQARELRHADPVSAKSLATRGEILSREAASR